ncbi:hypothetical protein FGO68_gene15918 [Halteria grandinella]|uniref:Uncharacterized protein n=1 Tax=Halteria grandinella TaxID=5974 RepID=A0A8J8P6T0_HALGN|nr:hypothetical protein FGO68_gene15918 [Halteria grandinella]
MISSLFLQTLVNFYSYSCLSLRSISILARSRRLQNSTSCIFSITSSELLLVQLLSLSSTYFPSVTLAIIPYAFSSSVRSLSFSFSASLRVIETLIRVSSCEILSLSEFERDESSFSLIQSFSLSV